jgi:hypothetical protein
LIFSGGVDLHFRPAVHQIVLRNNYDSPGRRWKLFGVKDEDHEEERHAPEARGWPKGRLLPSGQRRNNAQLPPCMGETQEKRGCVGDRQRRAMREDRDQRKVTGEEHL